MLPEKKTGRKETRQALYCRDCGGQQAVSGQKAGDRGVPRLRIEGETDTVSGWGPNMATGGVLTDIASGDVLLRGLPVQQRNEKLLGGLAVIDLPTGRLFGMFEFTAGCTETYDVQFLPRARNVSVLNLTDNAVRQALSAPDSSYWLRPENIVSDSSRFRCGITNPGWTNCNDICHRHRLESHPAGNSTFVATSFSRLNAPTETWVCFLPVTVSFEKFDSPAFPFPFPSRQNVSVYA